jgi:hypothetical protein
MPNVTAGPDILTETIFTVENAQGAVQRLSLVGLLARLLAGPEIVGFPQLAADQHGHWWRFLTRCGAKALREMRLDVPTASEQPASSLGLEIERALRAAAPEPMAWMLYQPDLCAPGFLQPPFLSPGAASNPKIGSCAYLSTLTGEKGHERKSDTGRTRTAEEAVYGLIELQLGAYYGGPKNYASQITADGYCGTPFMGARIGNSNSMTFQHDVQVLIDTWDNIVSNLKLTGDIWALWMEPWNLDVKHAPHVSLDPAFIPLARFVRLDPPKIGRFTTLRYWPTEKARVADISGGGNYGDPFVPLVTDTKTGGLKVRGTQQHGYNYREVVELLFPEREGGKGGEVPPSVGALKHYRFHSRPDLSVIFEGVAYKQGGTEGFHRRELILPASGPKRLGNPQPIRKVHNHMLNTVGKAEKALKTAVEVLLRGEREKRSNPPKVNPRGPQKAVHHLDDLLDRIYLDELFALTERYEAGDSFWATDWAARVCDAAWDAFDLAAAVLPLPDSRRWQRTVVARRRLRIELSKLAPSLKQTERRVQSSISQTELAL